MGNRELHERVSASAAIFMHRRERAFDTAQRSPVVDAALFRDAVNFIIENGAFRNWITIPADVAAEHEERVDHFLCPAMGTLREQLIDGSLLASIWRLIADEASANDRDVSTLLETVRAEARQKLEESKRPLTENDLIPR